MMLPSPGRATAVMLPLADGLKPASVEPSALSRARKLRIAPFIKVNEPPSTILPSGCTINASTGLFAPAALVNAGSNAPSVVNRVMRLTA